MARSGRSIGIATATRFWRPSSTAWMKVGGGLYRWVSRHSTIPHLSENRHVFCDLSSRLGEPRGTREEAHQTHHLYRLPTVLRRGLTHPAGERPDRAGGRSTDQQDPAAGPGQFSGDVGHQTGPSGTAGELRGGERGGAAITLSTLIKASTSLIRECSA